MRLGQTGNHQGMSAALFDAIDMGGVVPALLDFERMPGRYRLALREPSLLFEQTHAVMLLAAGRPVKGMAPLGEGSEAEAVQKAARYFVRMVLLRAGADHYTLLGLKPSFEPETLRDHYRLMIRLTHPDFSTPGEEWPADAASRINLANDVLGSSVKRGVYDAALKVEKAASSPAPHASGGSPPLPRPARAPIGAAGPRGMGNAAGRRGHRSTADDGWSARTKMVLAACGAMACVAGIWQLTPSGHDGSLVAKRDRAVLPMADSVSEASTDGALDIASTAPSRVDEIKASLSKMMGSVQAPPRKAQVAPLPATTTAPSVLPAATRVAPKAKQAELASASEAAPIAVHDEARPTDSAAAPMLTAERSLPLAVSPVVPTTTVATGVARPAAEPTPPATANTLPTAVSAAPLAPPSPPVLTLADVQPKLAVIMSALDRGRDDLAMDVLDPAWNNRDVRIEFLKGYYQFLQGHRVSQLNGASFRSKNTDSTFVVNGVLNLTLIDAGSSSTTRDLHIKAAFVRKDGKPIMTRLEASPAKP